MTEKSLEERIARLEAIHEIQQLMDRYVYLHTAGKHEEKLELFAMKTPGVRAEVANWGVYEGPEGIRRLYPRLHPYLEGDRIGRMFMHLACTPVIEVAEDGETARAVWISPGHETRPVDGKLKAHWCWGYSAIDAIKEDGKWKIWHYHVYGLFICPYDKSWVEVSDQPQVVHSVPDELKPDRPSLPMDSAYSSKKVREYSPVPPEPYKTFDEANSY